MENMQFIPINNISVMKYFETKIEAAIFNTFKTSA